MFKKINEVRKKAYINLRTKVIAYDNAVKDGKEPKKLNIKVEAFIRVTEGRKKINKFFK